MGRGITLAGTTAALLLLAVQPGDAQVTQQAFRGGRTSDLAALCGATGEESLGQAALGYCQGFFVGAGQYHRSLSAEGGLHRPIFCLPNPSPTFDQARTSFVAWARTPSTGTSRRSTA